MLSLDTLLVSLNVSSCSYLSFSCADLEIFHFSGDSDCCDSKRKVLLRRKRNVGIFTFMLALVHKLKRKNI